MKFTKITRMKFKENSARILGSFVAIVMIAFGCVYMAYAGNEVVDGETIKIEASNFVGSCCIEFADMLAEPKE